MNTLNQLKGANTMKKRNKKAGTTEKIVLATAILNLIFKLIEIIEKLIE